MIFQIRFSPFFFICLKVVLSQINGPIVTPLGTASTYTQVSDDGQIIVLGYYGTKNVDVYRNSGSGYSFLQTFPNTSPVYNLGIGGKGQTIALANGGNLEVYEFANTSNFELTQNITLLSDTYSVVISKDEKIILVGLSLGLVSIHEKNGSNMYVKIQDLGPTTSFAEAISITNDFEFIGVGRYDAKVYIYEKSGGVYNSFQIINIGFNVTYLKITNSNLLIAGQSSQIIIYSNNGTHFVIQHQITTASSYIYQMYITDNFEHFAEGGTNQTFNSYVLENGTYQLEFSYDLGNFVTGIEMDEEGLYYNSIASTNLYTFYRCPEGCASCSFPNNCSACNTGYTLNGVICEAQPVSTEEESLSHCVKNIFQQGNICEQYCSKKCKTCNQTKNDCYECSQFYTKNKNGECEIQNGGLFLITKIRPFINFFRRRGFKSMFLAVDDIWLYNYHKNKYDGVTKSVFETISFVEEKQWEISGLQNVKDDIEQSVIEIPPYNQYSNPTYLEQERKNDLFISSTLDYFSFFVPLSLIIIFALYRVFYVLFNFEISKYIRPYSFALILFDYLIQNNIQYFTFLGFRSLGTSFTFNFPSKMLLILAIIMFFFTVLGATMSYFLYYVQYGKLAKYFLANLFRFPSSYGLMIIMYGIRPFFKGAAHAILYEEWVIQMWTLMGIEILILIIIAVFEFNYDNHRSKIIFMMDMSYYQCLVVFDVLVLLKYEYFADDELIKNIVEELLVIVIYIMVIILLVKFAWEYVPFKYLKELCYDKNSSEEPQCWDNKNQQGQNKNMKETCKVQDINLDELINQVEEYEENKKKKVQEQKNRKGVSLRNQGQQRQKNCKKYSKNDKVLKQQRKNIKQNKKQNKKYQQKQKQMKKLQQQKRKNLRKQQEQNKKEQKQEIQQQREIKVEKCEKNWKKKYLDRIKEKKK